MTMIIGILGPGGSGGTFLDWTLHWLAGDRSYTFIDRGPNRNTLGSVTVAEVVPDPLQGTTAHKHHKTHPNDISIDECVSMLSAMSSPGIKTFYYVDSISSENMGLNHHELILKYPDILFLEMSFEPEMVHMIFCNQMEKIPTNRNRYIDAVKAKIPGVPSTDQIREILSLYYPLCIKGQLNLKEDSLAPNHFVIPFDHILHNLDDRLQDIFDFLQLSIDQRRIHAWHAIYKKWQDTATNKFFADLPEIVESVVRGYSKPLDVYDMTLAKEVIISNHLLFVHNLRLRLTGTENMPLNTRRWHDLLEPNIYHDLSKSKM